MALILKEEIKKLKLNEVEGEVIGLVLKDDLKFVLEKKGLTGLKKVETEMERFGCPLKYNEIKIFKWYPAKMDLILFIIQKTFDWPDEKIEELGIYAMKVSWIIRIFMKYFFSIEKILEEAQQTWSKYFTVGRLKAEAFNLEEKQIFLKVEDFELHPIYCHCLKGVFLEIARMALKPQKINCEEIKCSFDEGKEKEHHFLIKWK